jgi:hypothetical protein
MIDANDRPVENRYGFRTDPGSDWTHHILLCVATIKASVKTIALEVNSTASISNSVIEIVEDKAYNNFEPLPIQGAEGSEREMCERSPFWGLFRNEKSNSFGLQTPRCDVAGDGVLIVDVVALGERVLQGKVAGDVCTAGLSGAP